MARHGKYRGTRKYPAREPARRAARDGGRALPPPLALSLIVPLLAMIMQGCNDEAVTVPQEQVANQDETTPLVIVRRNSTGIEQSTASEVVSGGVYVCEDVADCWNQCPEPTQDGGTTVCRCVRIGGGNFTCSITFYGPEDCIPGIGCGGGGGGGVCVNPTDDETLAECLQPLTCGDERDGLAEELATHPVYNGPKYKCDEFIKDSRFIKWGEGTEFGLHGGYGYVHADLRNGFDKLQALWGKELHVTSGYRCPRGDVAAPGSGNGWHTRGRAADIFDHHTRIVEGRYPTEKEFNELRDIARDRTGGHTLPYDRYPDHHLHVSWRD